MHRHKPLYFLSLLAVPALMAAAPAMAAHTVPRKAYLHKSATAGTKEGKHLAFSGKRVVIPVVAVAPGAPGKTFEIHGMVNPTIMLPAGIHLRFELGNNDGTMPHGLAVTPKTPPYPDNVKREIKPPLAGTGYVNHESSGHGLHMRKTKWFTLKPGTYYYVCPVPTHAHSGMYGKIIVRPSGD